MQFIEHFKKFFLSYILILACMIFVIAMLCSEFDYARHMDPEEAKVYLHEGH